MEKEKFISALKRNFAFAFSYAVIFYSWKIDRYICIAAFLNEEPAREFYNNLIKKRGESTAKASGLELINLDINKEIEK